MAECQPADVRRGAPPPRPAASAPSPAAAAAAAAAAANLLGSFQYIVQEQAKSMVAIQVGLFSLSLSAISLS